MNKTIIVGERITRKMLLFAFIASSFIAWMFSSFIYFVFQNEILKWITFILLIFVFPLFYLTTLAADTNYWSVDSTHLTYFYAKNENSIEELNYLLNILKGKENASIKISLDEIEQIHLYWKKAHCYVWNHYAYTIMLGITLKNNTRVTFQGLYGDSDAFIQAMERLQKKETLSIRDPYKLLPVLKKPNANLYEYIQKLEGTAHE